MTYTFGTAFRLAVIFTASFWITGCNNAEEAAPASVSTRASEQIRQAESKAIDAERRRAEAVAEAEKTKQVSERQRQEALDAGKSSERVAWILGIFVVIALLVGVALGSSSRKDANASKQKID